MTPTDILDSRLERFRNIDIYPVISSEFTNGRDVLDVLKMIADGGAKIVQLREKNCSARDRFVLAGRYREITAKYNMLLIVDDDAACAAAVDADGVHLGQDDLPPKTARKLFPSLVVGVSTHDATEAVAAQTAGCGYLNIGPVFATATKTLLMAPVGLAMIDAVRPLLKVPFTVMGGIKLDNLAELRKHGVTRAAMVTEITRAADITRTVRELIAELAK